MAQEKDTASYHYQLAKTETPKGIVNILKNVLAAYKQFNQKSLTHYHQGITRSESIDQQIRTKFDTVLKKQEFELENIYQTIADIIKQALVIAELKKAGHYDRHSYSGGFMQELIKIFEDAHKIFSIVVNNNLNINDFEDISSINAINKLKKANITPNKVIEILGLSDKAKNYYEDKFRGENGIYQTLTTAQNDKEIDPEIKDLLDKREEEIPQWPAGLSSKFM